MAVEWSTDYETGVAEIDYQHRTLFKFVERLERAVLEGAEEKRLRNLIEFLDTYTITHFAFEETCMRRYQCPVAHKNRDAHEKFSAFFVEFKKEFKDNPTDVALLQKLLNSIEKWLLNHICKIDVKLRDSLDAFDPIDG